MHKLRDAPGESEEDLRKAVKELAGKDAIYALGLGNTDRADDGAGIIVAEALKRLFPSFAFSEHDGVEGIVLEISQKKEDLIVFFIDAANLHLKPGSIRMILKDDIRSSEVTTHRVMVSLMASILERAGKRSAVIGIQPERIEFRGNVSGSVHRACESVSSVLKGIMTKNNRTD